ncbi:predicted protein [Streptomyces iranensis]|uniref:Uncharacterized protein n=1 Tax=Streptomyces iranensis TaxID=576784 RepID=A0A060ZV44_9ACTN|nr:predicted protein [Streptomyces iranensis]
MIFWMIVGDLRRGRVDVRHDPGVQM